MVPVFTTDISNNNLYQYLLPRLKKKIFVLYSPYNQNPVIANNTAFSEYPLKMQKHYTPRKIPLLSGRRIYSTCLTYHNATDIIRNYACIVCCKMIHSSSSSSSLPGRVQPNLHLVPTASWLIPYH